MDVQTFRALLTPTGQAALAAATALAPTEETFLANLQRLQASFPASLAKAALETASLRDKARAKFSRAEAMYFTREALEQASGERLSRYRAARYAGQARVADLGCGLGGDSLGLAGVVPRVVGVDQDALRLAMAAENLAAYGLRERAEWRLEDLARLPWPQADAFFFDPARRAGGRRKFSVRDYEPPLAQVRSWLAHTPAGGVKISPGVDLAELAGYDAEVEFISERGALKECALWFGPLRTAARRATLLAAPSGAAHTLLPDPAAETVLGPPDAFLYEPDPAVLRAGLVTTLAARLGAHQLDPSIAYLAAPRLVPTPFARAYAVEDALPFQLKRLRARLRELHVGRVSVKKRGSPLEPEALIHQLRLEGEEERVVVLTQVKGKAFALVTRPAVGK